VGGMLKRHLAPETLRRLLRKELLPEDSDPNGENGNSKMLETLSRLANLRIEDLLRPGKGENKHVE
jgi:diadenylate cyclase